MYFNGERNLILNKIRKEKGKQGNKILHTIYFYFYFFLKIGKRKRAPLEFSSISSKTLSSSANCFCSLGILSSSVGIKSAESSDSFEIWLIFEESYKEQKCQNFCVQRKWKHEVATPFQSSPLVSWFSVPCALHPPDIWDPASQIPWTHPYKFLIHYQAPFFFFLFKNKTVKW